MNRLLASGNTVVAWTSKHCLVLLLLASAGLNVTLANELRTRRTARTATLEVGTKVTPFTARDLNGNPTRVDFVGPTPTVLYYFSASCGWCRRNWPNIEALAAQTRGRYRFIAIAASADAGADVSRLRGSGAVFDVLTGLDEQTTAAYGFRGTPQTVVVSAEGRVLSSWAGAYSGAVQALVERFFSATLPGTLPASPQGVK